MHIPGKSSLARRTAVSVASAVMLLVGGASFCAAALALPEGRVYEMVSPPYKGGFGTNSLTGDRAIVAPDGESVAFFSAGAFNGAPTGFFGGFDYLARRGASGWSTVSVLPPAGLLATDDESDLSESLDQVFVIGTPGASKFLSHPDVADLALHSTSLPDVSANWEAVGAVEHVEHPGEGVVPKYFGASSGFCHVLLSEAISPLLPGAVGASEPLYEFDRGCGREPSSLQLVGVNGAGQQISPACHTTAGGQQYTPGGSQFNAISVDGAEVFFTVCTSGFETGPAAPHQLFVRFGGSRTLEVSRPLGGCAVAGEVPCDGAPGRASADFVGGSEDGSRVFFTTAAPLAATDTDTVEEPIPGEDRLSGSKAGVCGGRT